MIKKVRDVIREIEEDGWTLQRRKGTAHRKFRHPTKPGAVTVSGNLGDDMAPGTYNSILRQAGLR
jgi:predicted RNA binding protein YcfA (HicA-like mRNA interferase family)